MTFMGDYSGLSFKDRPAAFIGGFVEGEPEQLVAVNSVHLAERFMARSRGLWVDPTYRGRGYGTTILNATNTLARVMGAEAIWTFPRKTSIHSYEEAGFKRMSSWLDHGEFGPNCYAICFLGK
jgi:GNAT superfamily N-acetyltransferase